jgi:hypothetical protein
MRQELKQKAVRQLNQQIQRLMAERKTFLLKK